MLRKTSNPLRYAERCHPHAYLRSGKSRGAIAKLMGCSHTTLLQGLKCKPWVARLQTQSSPPAHPQSQKKCKLNAQKMAAHTLSLIEDRLMKNQASPGQICGRLDLKFAIKISSESIFKQIGQAGTAWIHTKAITHWD